jgi:hypothetical protein
MVLGLTDMLLSKAVGVTVTANVLLTPVSDAVIVTGVEAVTAPADTVNVAEVEPCATMTLAGMPTTAVLGSDNQTVTPPNPAADVKVTVAVPECPLTIVLGLTEKVLRAGGGLTVRAKVWVTPPKEADRVMPVTVLTLPVVTEKVCDVEPCGTLTETGTEATFELELERVTTAPPEPAGVDSVTVPDPEFPLMIVDGVTEMPVRATGAGLTVRPVVTFAPENEAVMVTGVATLTLPAVTGNVAEVAPWVTVTLPGTFAPAGEELNATVAPPPKAPEVSFTLHVEPADGDTEVGLQETLLKLGVCWIVTVPLLAETGIAAPAASAAEPPASWTVADGSGALLARVRVTVASTAFGIAAVFMPHAMHLELPAVLVQVSDLLAAPGPGLTVTEEKSVVE